MIKPRFAARIKQPAKPYTPAVATNIAETFKRLRREQARAQQADAPARAPAAPATGPQVVPLWPAPAGLTARKQRGRISIDEVVALAAATLLFIAWQGGLLA